MLHVVTITATTTSRLNLAINHFSLMNAAFFAILKPSVAMPAGMSIAMINLIINITTTIIY